MKRLAILLGLACSAALTLVVSPAVNAAVLTTDPHVFTVTAKHRVHLEFPVGELKVVPGEVSKVVFNIRVKCRGLSEGKCEDLANELVFTSDDHAGTLHMKLEEYPKWRSRGFSLQGELIVPKSLPVEIDMGVGDLDVTGIEGDLDIDLGVGDADIRTRRAATGDVDVAAGVGDASIVGADGNAQRSGFVGSHASWSGGEGHSSVRLKVGVGEAKVRLE